MTRHTIKKGFDIPLIGKPETTLSEAPEPELVAVEPPDFPGIKPKVLVARGDRVRTGQPLFFDKHDPDRHFASPATGTVRDVELGERRFPLRVVVERQGEDEHDPELPRLDPGGLGAMQRGEIIAAIKRAGLWPLLRQRPLGRIARADRVPVAIYVNGMDTEPLAADPAFSTQASKADLQAGVELLGSLTDGKVYLTLAARGEHQSELRDLQGVEVHDFDGPHPAGLVGTHIDRIAPLKGDQVAWYLKAQELLLLGHWLRTGRYPTHRIVATAGSRAPRKQYWRVRQGAPLSAVLGSAPLGDDVRVINGTVLSGIAVSPDGYLGFYATTVTAIPEGHGKRDLFGWAVPQPGKLSVNRAVFSWLLPKPAYDADARLNGGRRPIINLGVWERMMPLDIHPTFLVRAIQAGDLEEAIHLGLLEVTEEDVALCTFADPCKIEVGEIIRKGLDMYEEEEGQP